MKELKGFERVALRPGETRRVSFTVDASALQFWGPAGAWGVGRRAGTVRRLDRPELGRGAAGIVRAAVGPYRRTAIAATSGFPVVAGNVSSIPSPPPAVTTAFRRTAA
ncbi:MAG: fibronectin type III-like domain-contianing protein [Thermoanaerobaculia bacterium]